MDSVNLNRRAFLKGRSPKYNPDAIYPPWSIEASRFVEKCERCDKCIEACPGKILVCGDGGFPEVDFRRGECTFCGDCVAACEADAFNPGEHNESNAWSILPRIANSCLSMNAITCRSCGDNCDVEAIRFHLQVGGIAIPVIDSDQCNGCGACLYVCPENSVTMRRKPAST